MTEAEFSAAMPVFVPGPPANSRLARDYYHLETAVVEGVTGPIVTDPELYAPAKRFGALQVTCVYGRHFSDESTGFALQEGQAALRLNLLEPKAPFPRADMANVSVALSKTARFIEAHNLDVACLYGITYERLGSAAVKRFGFSMTEPESGLADCLMGLGPRRMGARHMPGVNLGRAVRVYYETPDFLRRYGAPSGGTAPIG